MRKANFKWLVVCLLCSAFVHAQNESSCGFMFAQEYARKNFPDYDKKLKQIEEFDQDKNQSNWKHASVTQTIPVVFHVLHQNGSENISDAQIQSAMVILNNDFRKLNSDTTSIVSEFKPLAADCNIEFRLANLDPDGKCTNGITRHYTAKTSWTLDLSYYEYTWPSNKYLNVYVVKTMQSGAAGYTYLPGTVPAAADAIVILNNYLGNIGTGSNFGSRSLTHEVGHWLGLSHIWGSTNNPGVACGDDGITDTPITKGHTSCSLGNPSTCSASIVENIQNYMEYSFCCKMYTIGQSDRMNAVLASSLADRDNVVSFANMIATGIVAPDYNCAPRAEFDTPNFIVCENVPIQFTDYSYNGDVSNWLWSSTGATGTSTLQNGVLSFTNTGLLPVKLKVANSFGIDSLIKTNYVTVLADNGGSLNVTQGFETGIFPDDRWISSQPQYGSGFTQNNNVGASGQKCMYINNYLDNPNEPAYLYTPKFDLNNVTGAQLNFKYAYAQQGTNDDMLRIYITTDCAANWDLIYNQSGANLASRPPINGQAFTATLSSDWKDESVSLGQYQGQSGAYLMFEFTSDPTGSGNNFFIDDINLSGTVGIPNNAIHSGNIFMFPNPARDIVQIRSTNRNIDFVEIIDIAGKLIVTQKELNSSEISINTKSLSKGIYVVKICVKGSVEYKKLIIE